jgi:hypothetical protein
VFAFPFKNILQHQKTAANSIDTCRPVKNRDGPIAGIAHTGGGGSRQLGPDDNDPVSATQIRSPNQLRPFFLHTTINNNFAFLSSITHAFLNAHRTSKIPIFSSQFCFIVSINRMSGLATI